MLPYIAHAFPPQCITFHITLSIDHILLHCVRYLEARRSFAAFCEARRLPMMQTTLQDDEHPDVIDRLMIFLAETNLIKELLLACILQCLLLVYMYHCIYCTFLVTKIF